MDLKLGEMIGTILSGVSVLIAFVALLKSFFSDRKTKQLDLRLKQMELASREKETEESKKAMVEVNVVETDRRKANKMRFYNKGKAIAKNIHFTITSCDDTNFIQLCIPNNYMPYPQLLPQQSFDIPYWNNSDLPHHTINIRWEDEFSKERSVDIVVDL